MIARAVFPHVDPGIDSARGLIFRHAPNRKIQTLPPSFAVIDGTHRWKSKTGDENGSTTADVNHSGYDLRSSEQPRNRSWHPVIHIEDLALRIDDIDSMISGETCAERKWQFVDHVT